MEIHLSEARVTKGLTKEGAIIPAGSSTICHAKSRIITTNGDILESIHTKLDTCGSVSIAHSSFLTQVKRAREHGLPPIRLTGIGGKSGILDMVGILQLAAPEGNIKSIQCYVYDSPLGPTSKMLLLSLQSVIEASINIIHHMSLSNKGECGALTFWPHNKTLEQICNDIAAIDLKPILFRQTSTQESLSFTGTDDSIEWEQQEQEEDLVNTAIQYLEAPNMVVEEVYMTEIQLRRIVDRTSKEQQSDGDDTMIRNGKTISKFAKEAMNIGDEVYDYESILRKVYLVYERWVGNDSVFPVRNGAPKIMTKFKDKPYSYELLPEYLHGEKKFPCVKAMNWEGKTATCAVIRGFVKATPVVEKCTRQPLCISRLVIAPKFAPGQEKSDPDHGFRVCVNALVNKCLKPYGSTIPLAVDEIKKLHGYKYYLGVDGFSAYWSIPVCEESKRLTAFHTPDGIYCWNRLMMGATPSSAVQQTAYLEALDEYIDYDEQGNLRKCLIGPGGERLQDEDGNPKTLRHRFAVYCDDIAAGANTLEELYELFEALICACAKAGIQIKAAKVKFGVRSITFHNYIISEHGTEPKEANLCTIRNLKSLKDIHQIRAFLGCCQQLSHYIKDYGIIAKPLHNITKKGAKCPPPWIEGSDYDVAFQRLRAIISDTKLYLHNKDKNKRLFIEVDASDVGWGACAYQLLVAWEGDPADEGRARVNDRGTRLVIEWISKGWTTHEMQLPVFYRESLARVLCLEKFRNLIETNLDAGVTLYTDHKPALFENSLSNKGQLSAWKLTEVADLMSIVEHIYRQGSGMLLADPLSRVCAPTEGWYDPTLPSKLAALLTHMTDEVRNNEHVRVYCYQDTIAAARIVQRWRNPKNKVATGRLTQETKPSAFLIGTPTANSATKEVLQLITQKRQFAVLMPLSLVPEISRRENVEGARVYNEEVARKVDALSKIVLPSSAQIWLVNLPSISITKVLSPSEEGIGPEQTEQIIQESLANLFEGMELHSDWQENNAVVEMLPTTRSGGGGINRSSEPSDLVLTPAHGAITRSRSGSDTQKQLIRAVNERGRLAWKRSPREPLPLLPPTEQWVGIQKEQHKLPTKYEHEPPKGELVKGIPGRPAELLGIPNHLGVQPRIIVPKRFCEALTMHTHEDIHHQNHQKVTHLLKPLYYWPGMDRDIERFISSCETCKRGTVRRRHLKMIFDPNAPSAKALPRQHYGLDFYGVHKGEVLVIIDLFSREVILEHVATRSQLNVAAVVLKHIILSRGVPMSLRTDNAPELMRGAVEVICQFLNIEQITTGGHSPRGNAICERVNQIIGAMIRKLSDHEYKNLGTLYLPSFQFAINTTFNSAIGCTPFEAGHGLMATTITQARARLNNVTPIDVGGYEHEVDEDIDEFFDKDSLKMQLELAVRMAEVARSVSEWHRRMTAEKLNQSGQPVDMSRYPVGTKVFFYKPPSKQEADGKGRKVKHIDHYVGPARITKHIGTRSVQLEMEEHNGRNITYKRDIGMLLLRKPKTNDPDPTIPLRAVIGTQIHSAAVRESTPIEVGEHIIIKDGPLATTWYCAEVSRIERNWIEVNYFTTVTPSIIDYDTAGLRQRQARLKEATFLRTWVLRNSGGFPTTIPPRNNRDRAERLWRGRIPTEHLDEHILIRGVGLNARGKLDSVTREMASQLNIPHHCEA